MRFEPKNGITTRKRTTALLLIIFAVQAVIIGRYAWVQIVWSPKLQQLAVEQWTNDTKIAAKRGKILDRNYSPLAVSGNVERVDAFLKDINNAEKSKKITKEEIAEKLSPIISMKKEDIVAKLNKKLPSGLPMSSVTIVRRIEKEQGNKIRDLKLPGIVITEDTKRYYPNGNFLAHVIGNTNVDGDGRAGIELQYNDVLKGVPGRIMGETDAYHRELPSSLSNYISPQNGKDVVLTIDQSIQYFTEKAIEKGLVDYKAKQISAVIMDPKTGEILAMANKPDYDPNNPVKGTVESSIASWRNRSVNDNYEPGSVLKVITASAGVEENIVNDQSRFVCKGSYKVADRIIHCWKRTGHGTQTFEQILQNSCNVGFMILGQDLGREKLYKYFNAFGFGKKTNIDLPGEEKGILRPVEKVGPVELANEAFGQGISVTTIQYLTALAAAVNNGNMVQPHILKQVLYTDSNGNTSVVQDVKTKVIKQVISEKSSKKIRDALESVVTLGAGKKAYVDGYHVGGKTGTAQIAINGVYVDGKYNSSFAGVFPCNDPKYVMLVSLNEPDPTNYYSGSTAAPIAKQIIEDIIRYTNMQQDAKSTGKSIAVPEVIIPEVRNMSVSQAQNILKKNKLNFETDGTGSIIYDISPKPGVAVKENSKIVLYLGVEKNKDSKVSVPDFTGRTKKEILDIAQSIGIKILFTGDGIGETQDVGPGKEVEKNSTVNVILEKPED